MNQELAQRGLRKTRTGVVVSNKMDKTIVVRVERVTRHPLYGKVLKSSKKYYAHHEGADKVALGETVTIEECRPMSRLKRWRVTKETT